MKKFLPLFFSFSFALTAFAQTPPPPCDPGDFSLSGLCAQACVICESIDGLFANNDLPAGAAWEAPPGFCAPGLHNTQWIGFVASSPNLTLAITPSNCNNDDGLQIGIYNTVDCTSTTLVSNCEPDVPANQTFLFVANQPLIVGGIYYLVIDGFLGDVCDFTVQVLDGDTGAPDVNGSAPITGPLTICPGGSGSYFADLFGASVYEWTLDGDIIGYQPNVNIDFPITPGSYQLCVTPSNPCSEGDQSCVTINVQPLPPLTQNVTICEGDTYELGGQLFSATGTYNVLTFTPEGCAQDVILNLTVQQPQETNLPDAEICAGEVYLFNGQPIGAPGLYTQNFQTSFGCDSIVNLNLIVHLPGSELVEEEICDTDPPVIVAGQPYSQTGLYTIFTQTTEGCDSTIFLRLDVFEPSDVTLDTTICQGEFMEVGFAFYDQPGVYQATLQGQGGCDSTITVNLSISDPQTSIAETICSGESFTIGGVDYSTTGIHTETLPSFLGCDSVVTLDLTVLAPISSVLNIEICEGETYTLNGTPYDTEGNYQEVFTAVSGCDSTVFLDLDILPNPTLALTEVLCPGNTFTVGDSTYTETGMYSNTFTAANGCDSTVTLDLTINAPIETTLNESICDGSVFTVGMTDYSTAGSHTEVLTAANGCDSTVFLNLTILPNPETMFSASICEGETYEVGNNSFNQSGIYTEVLTAANGCDSTVTLDLTVNVPPVTNLDVAICTGQTYSVGGSNYTMPGSYTDVLTSVVTGCDSIVNLELSIEDVLEEFLNITLCEGESYFLGGTNYDATGNYQASFVTADGCDSIAYLDLTVNPNLETFLSPSICDGESFQVGSFSYTATGLYSNTLTSIVTGCDSTVFLDLTVLDVPNTVLTIDICDGETYSVGSSTYSTTGMYQDILTAANGCDSIIDLNLQVLNVPVTALDIDICDGETYSVGNSTYDATGVYQNVLIAANGCDSIVDLNLEVLNVPQTTLTEQICDGETFSVGTSNYTSSGIFTDVLTAANGCDSIVTLALTVAPIQTVDLVAAICNGGSFTVGTSSYSATGTYQDILTSSAGCDSIVNLDLTVTDFYETNLVQEICEGETFSVGSSVYNTTGMYTDNFISLDGCDSIVNLDLTVNIIPVTNLTEVICDGESVQVGLSTYSSTGTFQDILTAQTGCDSIINLDLTVNPVFETNLVEAICDGETYSVGSSNYTTPGFYQDLLTATNGCDSVVNLNLTVNPIPVTDLTETICFGDTYGVGTSSYTTSGTYQDILTAVTGCDSIVNLDLTVTEYIETNLDEIICFGDTYTVGISVYDASGTYQDILTAANGCDSVVNLVLTERNLIETNLVEDICAGESFEVGGTSFSASGVYTQILTSIASGCDSVVTLDLNVIPLPQTFLTEAICDGESFEVGSSSYTSSGIYQDVLTSLVSGCDSIVSLNLTVYEIPVTDLAPTICFGDTYTVGTSSYDVSGTYQDVLTAFTGCDSIVNLNLTVTEFIETNLDEIICFGDTYSVGSSTYDASGTYQDILTAVNGCDSVVNLVLTERNLIETALVADICAGETYQVGNESFDATGIYTEVLTSIASGCDSIVTLDLNVIPLEETFLTEAICDGESFGVGSSTYTTMGTYQDVLTAASGCDSIVYLDLTVFEIPVTNLTPTICFGDTYTVGTSSYDVSGTYQDVLTAFTGCDSIVNLNLTVTEFIETNLDEIICFGDTYSVGSSTYDASGTYQDILTAVNGCDSVVNLVLTERNLIETALVADICAGETYQVGSESFDATGIYTEVLTSIASGCDSIVTLDLNVIPLEETFLTEEICDGESFGVGSSTYTTMGTYQDILTAASGCDSIVYLDLTVFEIPMTTLTESICDGETFGVGSSTYTTTGSYQDILTAVTGCDSIVNLELNVIELPETFLTQEICNGESFSVGSSSYTATGSYQDVLTAASGCDSTVYLDLVVNEVFEIMLDESICSGETYTVGTSGYDQSGDYQDVLNTVNGCDSVVNLSLYVFPCQLDLTVDDELVSCNGGSDGSIIFNMNIGTPPYTYDWEALAGTASGSGDVPTNGMNETIEGLAAGNYRITITDVNDIVEIITTTVTQPAPVSVTLELSDYMNYNVSCPTDSDGFIAATPAGGTPPYSYAWSHGGVTASANDLGAGTFSVTVTDQNGCETMAEATLIAPAPMSAMLSHIDPACFGDPSGEIAVDTVMGGVEPYLYAVDGRPFSGSPNFGGLEVGMHTVSVQDANGCIWEEQRMITEPDQLFVDLGDDILEFKLGDSTQLFADVTHAVDTFIWSFPPDPDCSNCPTQTVTPVRTGQYYVTVVDEFGCEAYDDIRVFVNRPYEVFIPNAFSPNGDGTNDELMIFAGDDVRRVNKFMVFNRWGETMFELQNFPPNDPTYGWKGTHRNQEMNTGVYVYLAEVEFIDGEVVLFKGDAVLMR